MAKDEQAKKILDDPEVGGALKAEAARQQDGQTEAQSPDPELVERLQSELEQAKQSQEEMLAQTQRTLADYANLKKRFDKERTDLSKFASEMTLLQLLPAIDNLERAVSYASGEDKKNTIVMGVIMTLQQLDDTLEGMGLKRMSVKAGDAFDPHQHEAVESVAGEKDKIAEVLQAGYMLHDKVVRPARVKVGNGEEGGR